MGTGQYFFASNFSHEGITATAYVGPGAFTILLLFKMLDTVRMKCQTGSFINYSKSNLWDKEGKVQWINLVPLLGNLYANSSHLFFFSYSFKFAKWGGLERELLLSSLFLLFLLSVLYEIFLRKSGFGFQ